MSEQQTPRPWHVGIARDGRVVSIDGPDLAEVVSVRDEPEHTYPELQSGTLVLSHQDADLIVAAVNASDAHAELETVARAITEKFGGGYTCGCCQTASFLVGHDECDCGCHTSARDFVRLREALEALDTTRAAA